MIPLRTAVIGTGHLGRIHARLAAEAPHIDLVAVVDTSPETRQQVAQEVGTRPLADHHELPDNVEAAIVATPTIYHASVVKELLQAGRHVLVEKPITTTVAEAEELVELAHQQQRVLQVGHVERFNPGLECIVEKLQGVRYLQATRASGYTFRSTDIGVVMDLMIHDIDVVLSLVRSPVTRVSAIGAAVLGHQEDMAQAQLEFENGCLAQLTASRVSYQPARTLQAFCPHGYAHVDFAARKATFVEPRQDLLEGTFNVEALDQAARLYHRDHLFEDLLKKSEVTPRQTNAIAEEHRDFAESIRHPRQPRVTGQAGRDALAIAERVLDSIAQHRWQAMPEQQPQPLRKAG